MAYDFTKPTSDDYNRNTMTDDDFRTPADKDYYKKPVPQDEKEKQPAEIIKHFASTGANETANALSFAGPAGELVGTAVGGTVGGAIGVVTGTSVAAVKLAGKLGNVLTSPFRK